MKPKAHILIVEDKAILYKRMATVLQEHCYAIDSYTPSVSKALERINQQTPDLVLLDIDLKGKRTGLDLGKLLANTYHIPFIYVTDYEDDQTFFDGLHTNHERFIVKTKPQLNTKEILRAIQTVLNRNKTESPNLQKEALLCFTDYVNKLKSNGNTQLSEVPVLFVNIAIITTKSKEIDTEKTKRTGKVHYLKLKPNYVRIEDFQHRSFYLPVSLSEILGKLPNYFVRINESEIINISEHILDGRINGSRIAIDEKVHTISKTYKAEVEKRFDLLYQRMK